MAQGENDLIQGRGGKRYALVVGVNSPARVPELPALTYAESDALGLSWLLEREESGFALPSPALLGPAAGTQAVRHAMGYLIDERSEDDLLLFYFAGHGYPVSTSDGEREVYLATADFDPYLAKIDPTSCLSLNWLRQMLFERNKNAHVIVILDCCYSSNVLASSNIQPQEIQEDIRRLQPGEVARSQSRRSLLFLASTATDKTAYEEHDARGEGHALITGLLLKALGGRDQEALDNNGDLTLHTLYTFLCKQLSTQSSQIQKHFAQDLILAHRPAQHPFLLKAQDFLSVLEGSETRVQPASSTHFFDTSICLDATFADLDTGQIETFFQNELTVLQEDYLAGASTRKQLEAFGFLQHEHPSYGALLCFGLRPSRSITGAYTRCILWNDTDRLTGWQDKREYRGSLLEQFVQARDFLRKSLHFGRLIERGGSREQPEIPFRAFEEILANALVHREYVSVPDFRQRTEGTLVEIFEDRVEICSPGTLPTGLEPETLQKTSGRSLRVFLRNPQIARIFYLTGHIEAAGTGIGRVYTWMQEADLPPPLFSLDQSTQTLVVTFRRVPAGKRQGSPFRRDEGLLLPESAKEWSLPPLAARPSPTSFLLDTGTFLRDTDSPLRYPDDVSFRHTPSRTQATRDTDSPFLSAPKRSTEPLRALSSPHAPGNNHSLKAPSSISRRWLFAILLLIGAILLASFFLNAYTSLFAAQNSPIPAVTTPSTTIEIASDFATSGVDTASGLPLQSGVQMAIDQANAQHLIPGYTLTLRPFNDVGANNRFDPAVGAKNIGQAAANGLIAGVVGPGTSAVARAELPIANRASLPLLSPNNTFPCLTRSSSVDLACSGSNDILAQMRPTGQLTYFRIASTDDLQGKAVADYLFKTLHYRHVVILKDDTDPYSQGLAQAVQNEWLSLDASVTALDVMEAGSSVATYQGVLQSVISTRPDLIYFAGNTPNDSYALQALANIPALRTVAFAGGDGILNNGFLQAASLLSRSAPIYASLPVTDPAHAGTSIGLDFQEKYTAAGYHDYNPYVASAYDCTMMLIQAIKKTLQSDVSTPHGSQDKTGATRFRQAILQTLAHLTYSGATGSQSFDANGDTTNQAISFYRANVSTSSLNWQWLQQIHPQG